MNEAGNPTTSSCRVLKLAIGSVVHSENLPKVSFGWFFLPKPLHLMGKTGGQTAIAAYDSLINAAQRWMLESQLDKESHDFQVKASTVEFDPQTLSKNRWHCFTALGISLGRLWFNQVPRQKPRFLHVSARFHI